MAFAEKVRKRLEELKLAQTDMAEAIGTSQPQVSSWLNQGVMPATNSVVKVAKYLHLSLDYLLDDSQESEPQGLTEAETLILDIARRIGAGPLLQELVSGYASRSLVAESSDSSELLRRIQSVTHLEDQLRIAISERKQISQAMREVSATIKGISEDEAELDKMLERLAEKRSVLGNKHQALAERAIALLGSEIELRKALEAKGLRVPPVEEDASPNNGVAQQPTKPTPKRKS